MSVDLMAEQEAHEDLRSEAIVAARAALRREAKAITEEESRRDGGAASQALHHMAVARNAWATVLSEDERLCIGDIEVSGWEHPGERKEAALGPARSA